MRSLEKIKELVGQKVKVEVPSIENVSSAIEENKEIIENARKIRKTLEDLKEIGVKSVININYENKKIKIHGRYFLMMAQKGYEISIEREERDMKGSVEINSVEVIGNLDKELAKSIIREQRKFEFVNSDHTARDLKEFKKAIKKVPLETLEHHYGRGDFRRWLGRVLRRGDLVRKIDDLRENIKGEKLRKSLLKLL